MRKNAAVDAHTYIGTANSHLGKESVSNVAKLKATEVCPDTNEGE